MIKHRMNIKGKMLLLIVFLVLLVSCSIISINITLTEKSKKLILNGISEKISELQNLSKTELKTFKQTVNHGIQKASGVKELENIWAIVLKQQNEYNNVVLEQIEDTGKNVENTLSTQHHTVRSGLERLLKGSTTLMNEMIDFDNRSLSLLSNVATFNVDSLKEANTESLEIFSQNIDETEELLSRMQEQNKEDLDSILAEIITKSDTLQGQKLMEDLVGHFETFKQTSDTRVQNIQKSLRKNFDTQSQVISEEIKIVADKVNLAIANELHNSKVIQKQKMDGIVTKFVGDKSKIQNDIQNSIVEVNHSLDNLEKKLPYQLKENGERINRTIKEKLLDSKKVTSEAEIKISGVVDKSNETVLARINSALAGSNKVIEKTFNEASKKNLLFSLAIATISAIFAITLGALLVKGITTPISKVMEFAGQVSLGKRTERLPEGTDEIGKMGAALNAMVDELKKLEEVNENSFHQTLDQVFDCVFMFDPENLTYFFVNKGAIDQTGYSREELLELTPLDIKTDFDKKSFRELLRSLTTNERDSVLLNTVHKRKDGTHIPVEVLMKYVVPTIGRGRYVEIVRDISEIQRAEREKEQLQSQLLHAQKLESVGQLAAGIAHEINTPMQFISTNIEFLDEASEAMTSLTQAIKKVIATAPPDVAKELNDILTDQDWDFLVEEIPSAIRQSKSGIGRVTSIVKAMKEFSHPSSKEKEEVVINSIINSTVLIARNEWKYVSDVTTDLDEDLPPVPCLVDELGQVILNLLINASQAIEEKLGKNPVGDKGEIHISTRTVDSFVEVRIQDTGNGIPENIQEKIFDPFFTTKEVGKGTGQGLAISHDVITQKHNGTLTFETEKGIGTAFIIRLPRTT